MKIVINKTKLLYFDASTYEFNLGNFPETGKSITLENDNLLKFFQLMTKPVEYNEAISLLQNINQCEESEAINAINYLISEKILIDNEDYEKLKQNKYYGRELSYFFMLSNKNLLSRFEKERHKQIAILGVGGIGSFVAEMLIRAGFDNLFLIDNDIVEPSNLIRQVGYSLKDIGNLKLTSMFDHLKEINPDSNIKIANVFIDEKKTLKLLIKDADFVVCTFDKPFRKIRPLINEVCVELEKPVLFSGFAEHVGMVGPFVVPNKTACLSCINSPHNEPLNELDSVPSYGPLCGIVGNFVSNEVINFFIRFKKSSLQNKTLMINLFNNRTKIIRWSKRKDCPICGRKG